MNTDIAALTEEVQQASAFVHPLLNEVGKVIVGQKYLVERLVIGLLANGHMLLEGVPGLAKTLSVKTLASTLNARFSRIQFTPDMLPADVVGTQIYNPQSGAFTTRQGPIFANLVLADEINRAPAKVQSALLEAMQERQVTIGGETYLLPQPFLVLATENPIEQEGTYPLPEAQVDRIHVAPTVQGYILSLVRSTRALAETDDQAKRYLNFGASPRASLALYSAGRALAWLRGQDYVSPSLVQELAPDVFRHRVGLTYEAEAEEVTADKIIAEVLAKTPVPAVAKG